MIRFQPSANHTATQTSKTVNRAQSIEFLGREAPAARILRRPAFATVVDLRDLYLLSIFQGPPLAARDYLFAIAFVVAPFGGGNTLAVVCCPPSLVCEYSFLVLFLVLKARLDPMGQIGSGFLVLSILI
ncbi:MAG: hypothetical protein H0V83_00770 [Rubrobacter sp.]|nr:hypothetical protein [Rubrobacter sp.]